jgi:hypothetical protein
MKFEIIFIIIIIFSIILTNTPNSIEFPDNVQKVLKRVEEHLSIVERIDFAEKDIINGEIQKGLEELLKVDHHEAYYYLGTFFKVYF